MLHTRKYKKVIKNNKFKISAPTWNVEIELLDVSYPVSDIKDCFEYTIKISTDSPLLITYVNKIENKITF